MTFDGVSREINEVVGGNPARDRVVVITGEDGSCGATDSAERFGRKRPVPYDIAQADDFLGALRLGVLQDGFECLQVRVDVRDYRVLHGRVL